MGNAYRTLVLRYNLLQLEPDVAEKISALIKIQEVFRQWADEWGRSGGRLPLPERGPLRRFAKQFLYGGRALSWLRGLKNSGLEVRKMRPPLFFDVQLRLEKEHDIASGVFVDLPSRQVRIRKWSNLRGNTIVLPLYGSAVKWIRERVQEGASPVLAAVWIGRKSNTVKLHVALIFRREVVPMRMKRLLVIDFNALHNGVAYAVVEEKRIVVKGVMRPNVSGILHLQKVVSRLDAICAKKDKACEEVAAVKSRIWRILRNWEDDAAKKLLQLALQYKAAVVVDIPADRSIRKLKESGRAERKVFLNFGRLRRRLRDMAEWYGVPYGEVRLYSTRCPRCEKRMTVLPNRRVRCAACGFEAHRDEVPALWAVKLFPKLISFSSPFSARACGAPGLCCLQKLIL